LKKKVDTCTILVLYLLDTQDRYVKRTNVVDIDIREVKKLSECMSASDWNTLMDHVEKKNAIGKMLNFLKNRFPLDVVHAEVTAMRRIIDNLQKSPVYQKDTRKKLDKYEGMRDMDSIQKANTVPTDALEGTKPPGIAKEEEIADEQEKAEMYSIHSDCSVPRYSKQLPRCPAGKNLFELLHDSLETSGLIFEVSYPVTDSNYPVVLNKITDLFT
jgi:hypothetical protein